MKLKLTAIIALLASPLAIAGGKHPHGNEHGEHATKGPNGGQVVKSKAGFAFEITVDKERKARIVFLDEHLKPVALEARTVTGIAGERSAPVKLAFAKAKDADVLVSDNALPAGEHVPMLLMVKTSADAKAADLRFELELH